MDVDIAKLMGDGYFDHPTPVAKAVKQGLTSNCLVLYNVFAPFSSILYALDVIAQGNRRVLLRAGRREGSPHGRRIPPPHHPQRIQWVIDAVNELK
ncbi:MAG: hypothetical protein IJX84_06030 [Clostridia bacterium]|nr:hypothetical protein [Clostridia bacterium]